MAPTTACWCCGSVHARRPRARAFRKATCCSWSMAGSFARCRSSCAPWSAPMGDCVWNCCGSASERWRCWSGKPEVIEAVEAVEEKLDHLDDLDTLDHLCPLTHNLLSSGTSDA